MKKENLLGKTFNKLTVIESVKSTKYPLWKCKCECGNTTILRTARLKIAKSCGCKESKFKPNQKFNKLTLIEKKDKKWFCKCDCGNFTTVSISNLVTENTKSCGCMKKKHEKKKVIINRKYNLYIGAARRVWRGYYHRDSSCTIEFEDWLRLSQQECFYCGSLPNQKHKTFIYNGLDRIDSTKNHNINNVVACCWLCNRGKSSKTIKEFIAHINKIKNEFNDFEIKHCILPENLKHIKCSYYYYKKNYNKMEINLQTFYNLTQMQCYYCGVSGSNCIDKQYYYNGIDRIDNSGSHTIDNVVPCCKRCNLMKNDMTILKFKQWVKNIKNNRFYISCGELE